MKLRYRERAKNIGLAMSLCAVLAVAGTAQAQPSDAAQEVESTRVTVVPDLLVTSSTSSTTTTLATGLGIFSVQLATGSRRQLQAYLRRNAVAIQYDLHLGAGDLARDLAAIFEVDAQALPQFAQLLFYHRHDLAPLVEPGDISAEKTDQFIAIVGQAIESLVDGTVESSS